MEGRFGIDSHDPHAAAFIQPVAQVSVPSGWHTKPAHFAFTLWVELLQKLEVQLLLLRCAYFRTHNHWPRRLFLLPFPRRMSTCRFDPTQRHIHNQQLLPADVSDSRSNSSPSINSLDLSHNDSLENSEQNATTRLSPWNYEAMAGSAGCPTIWNHCSRWYSSVTACEMHACLSKDIMRENACMFGHDAKMREKCAKNAYGAFCVLRMTKRLGYRNAPDF